MQLTSTLSDANEHLVLHPPLRAAAAAAVVIDVVVLRRSPLHVTTK